MQYTITGAGPQRLISLDGSFTFDDHPVFRALLRLLEADGINACELDLSGVSFIDSAALGMLLLLREKAQAHGFSVTLARPRGQVKKMLDISEFGTMFRIEHEA